MTPSCSLSILKRPWDVYEFSSPFQEIIFSPAIGLGRPVFNKNEQLAGLAELRIEHKSNGRDSIYSRSWNNISLSYHTRINNSILLSIKAWIPFAYKDDNPDLMNYIGYGELTLTHDIRRNWVLDINLKKGNNWDWKGSLRTRLLYRVSKSTNQHVMLEWFTGYGESLLNFDQHRSMIRFGYVIKSPDLNLLKAGRD